MVVGVGLHLSALEVLLGTLRLGILVDDTRISHLVWWVL